MPQSVHSELTDKIPELDKIRLNSNETTALAEHHPKAGKGLRPRRGYDQEGQIIQKCKIEERDGDILIQPSAASSVEVASGVHPEHGDKSRANSPAAQNAGVRPALETTDGQKPEDSMSQVGNLWSRSMIEVGNRLCPKCNKRVPSDFKKCSHCGEYFDGMPQKNHCPNCGHDCPFLRFPRSTSELSSLLLNGVVCQVCGYKFERKTKFVRWFSLSCLVFTILWAAWFSMKSYGMLESVF